MRIHRLAAQAHARTIAEAFSGAGGLHGMGRWHTLGRRIVYCGSHLSLASLELLAHLGRADHLQPFVRYEAEVPERAIRNAAGLPSDWAGALGATQAYGDRWLAEKSSAARRVPSVLVPAESNVLLNPEHPDFSLRWVVGGPFPFVFDPRLARR